MTQGTSRNTPSPSNSPPPPLTPITPDTSSTDSSTVTDKSMPNLVVNQSDSTSKSTKTLLPNTLQNNDNKGKKVNPQNSSPSKTTTTSPPTGQ